MPGEAYALVRMGAPGRIRTCDQRIRSPTLYPAELRARGREESLRWEVDRARGFLVGGSKYRLVVPSR
jgi:hypothetical protein